MTRPVIPIPSARHALTILVLTTLLGFVACSPGLAGRWRTSGEVNQPTYFRFAGTLELDSQGRGLATIEVAGRPEVRVRACGRREGEQGVLFVLDVGSPPSARCETLRSPVTLRGKLGEHVLTGEVQGPDGRKVGLWRALRHQDK